MAREPTTKELRQARAFLMKNKERPRKGVPINQLVREFATLSLDLGLTFTQLLVRIRHDRASRNRQADHQAVE